MTDLFELIGHGDANAIASLIQAHSELVNARNAQGVSAVSWAMYNGKPAIAQQLIEHGAMLDLFEAATVGDVERVQILIERDPTTINDYSNDGFQPLGLAAFFGHEAIARVLIDHGAAINSPSRNAMHVMPLHSAAAGNHRAIAQLLLEHGADVNATQSDHFRPIDSAIQNDNSAMITLLERFGATRT